MTASKNKTSVKLSAELHARIKADAKDRGMLLERRLEQLVLRGWQVEKFNQ
jgi:hypothetical protein